MKYIIMIMALSFMGCRTEQEKKENPLGITYAKDLRTGFCFAIVASVVSGGIVNSISQVPCSPEVESLIK